VNVKSTPTKTAKREKIAIWLDNDQVKWMRDQQKKDGMPMAERIRRAVQALMKKKDAR
jgi:hypothetical protein